jgi:hypothetical protein
LTRIEEGHHHLKKGTKKRPVGRPRTGRRPVIAFRINQQLYDRLHEVVRDSEFSISEVIQARLELTFQRDDILDEARKKLADAEALAGRSVAMAARAQGWREVGAIGGSIWLEPGVDVSGGLQVAASAATIAKAIQPELVKLITGVLERLAKEKGLLTDRKK